MSWTRELYCDIDDVGVTSSYRGLKTCRKAVLRRSSCRCRNANRYSRRQGEDTSWSKRYHAISTKAPLMPMVRVGIRARCSWLLAYLAFYSGRLWLSPFGCCGTSSKSESLTLTQK